MKDAPLLTVTKIIDAEMSHEVADVGALDYRVHHKSLEQWLAAGAGRREPQAVHERQLMFAQELRQLADAMEQGAHPFVVTIESAEKLATERRASLAEWLRKNEVHSVPT